MRTITIAQFNKEFNPGQEVKFTSDFTNGVLEGEIGIVPGYKNNLIFLNNGEEIFAEEIRAIEKTDG